MSLRSTIRTIPFLSFLLVVGTSSGQTSRPFSMSSTGIQAYPNQTSIYQNALANFPAVLSDADVLTIFPEYLGIPFDSFATSANPSPTDPWTVQMTALANAAVATGRPLMMEIVLTRDFPVSKAVNNNGTLQLQTNWAPTCMDFTSSQFASVGTAYVNYADWIAKTFAPKYLVLMIENNLYYVLCGGDTPSWQAFVNIERNAYDSLKAQFPSMLVFPSFKLEDLYDQTLTGFDSAEYVAMANLKRDRFGIATYPFGVQVTPGDFANPYQLPSDYLLRVRDRYPAEFPVVITETGWNSSSIAISYNSACYANLVYSDPSFEAAYMDLLIYSGYVGNFDLISWWSDRDLIVSSYSNACVVQATPPSFPECNADPWCIAINNARAQAPNGWSPAFAELAFKVFGTMGLRDYNGNAKPNTLSIWNTFLALPLAH